MTPRLQVADAFAVRATFASPLVLTSSFVAGTVYPVTRALLGISLACKYTRASGAAGAPEMRIEWSRDQADWFYDPAQGVLSASAPYGSIPSYLGTYPLPVPADNSAIFFLIPRIGVPDGARFMKASFKDGGMSPGTLAVELWPGLVQS